MISVLPRRRDAHPFAGMQCCILVPVAAYTVCPTASPLFFASSSLDSAVSLTTPTSSSLPVLVQTDRSGMAQPHRVCVDYAAGE